MTPKHISLTLSFIAIVVLSIFFMGCTAERAPDNQSLALTPTTPTLTATSVTEMGVDMAKERVRNYTGFPHLELTWKATQKEGYLLESDAYLYYVNRTAGSVYLLNPNSSYHRQWSETLPPEIIDLEQGRAIAEAVARSNNPDLFQDSSTHKLTFGSDINDRGDGGREFNYHWAEYLNYPDKFTEPHLVIRGLNDTHIVLSPYTGEILSQWGWSAPLDPTLSLNPTVTNDQALEIAKVFAATQFFTIPGRTPEPKDWTTEGLLVMYPYAKSEAKTQHLAWGFEVRHHSAGGLVYVDAHDGSILGSNEMV
jgi:hypothetical protein